jgi:patatin-like phospholipase/acyl hydrolase
MDVRMSSSGNNKQIRRILSIDGGGIKGTMPAAFLAGLEEDLGQPIGRYFDLIAGTSTGGIIALGLGLGRTAKELLELYERRGPVIFGEDNADGKPPGRMRQAWRTLTATGRHVVGPKHDAAILARELKTVLNDDLIGQSQTRLVIPAWDADLRSPYIYKTAHHTRLQTDYRKTALDAALATAAAPTYFKRHRTADDIGLTDGGTWANNPTAIAVVEAITLLGWHPSDLRILSLGCLDEVYMLPESPGFAGLRWAITWRPRHGKTSDGPPLRWGSHLPHLAVCPERVFYFG